MRDSLVLPALMEGLVWNKVETMRFWVEYTSFTALPEWTERLGPGPRLITLDYSTGRIVGNASVEFHLTDDGMYEAVAGETYQWPY